METKMLTLFWKPGKIFKLESQNMKSLLFFFFRSISLEPGRWSVFQRFMSWGSRDSSKVGSRHTPWFPLEQNVRNSESDNLL